ncbi:MAG: class I SAM-dependent methyltransferase [Geminicoccaceae bacterium]|nr:class I SAM-dependent methyltransferase [Geminicoccaceae bacterium]MCS7267102.1 class I SAM-dependent methyltransferase [Geminicoccaceae bacterium]MCX7630036.1 class I SAM-dependent methyltransferase [Geminicoccaceae bacterium]MDW8124972.1 class I SAM-dependent methyltransferase [Geminicoccaceae bacterium]MDW8341726.1 class I SAM-dependent methyltransferase [Geminicoccaceae bacterium]
MDKEDVVRRKSEIVARYGSWTAHEIDLGGGISTLGRDFEADKLTRIVQIVADLSGKAFEDLRILDLGCLEGGYAVEFARRGARVVAIEGRLANFEKARFAKEVLGLDRLELVLADVRELAPERWGRFDVVLCLGLLYHLDAPDCFALVHAMAEVATRLVVIDTYVGIGALEPFAYRGRTYWGRRVREHDPDDPPERRLADLWASLDNVWSVWMAKPSLLNLLADAGFSSVFVCEFPFEPAKPSDRLTLVAVRGERRRVRAMPKASEAVWDARLPFRERRRPSRKQRTTFVVAERLAHLVPKRLRRLVKRLWSGAHPQSSGEGG